MLVSQLLCVMRHLHTCGPWISTVVCSTYVPRLRSWIGVVLVAHFDDAQPPLDIYDGEVTSFADRAHHVAHRLLRAHRVQERA